MAYSTSAPPALLMQRLGGGGQIWDYRSTDAATVVDGANYITNGGSLGMLAGSVCFVTDTDNGTGVTTLHQVNATGDGTTDLADLTTITQTDSD